MTLCIGAICEGGRNIVLTGDRRIILGADMLTFNLVHPKNPKMVIAGAFGLSLAGRYHPEFAQYILREAEEKEPECFDDFFRIVKNAYCTIKAQKLDEHVRDITPTPLMEDFISDGGVYSKEELQKLSADYTLQTEFIIAGFNSNGIGHLTHGQGDNPTPTESPFHSYDLPGWICIGVSAFASHYLANKITPSTSLKETVYALFSAHRFCSDTGDYLSREVDIAVLDRKDSYFLGDETISQLEAIHKEERRESARSLEEALKKVNDIALSA